MIIRFLVLLRYLISIVAQRRLTPTFVFGAAQYVSMPRPPPPLPVKRHLLRPGALVFHLELSINAMKWYGTG